MHLGMRKSDPIESEAAERQLRISVVEMFILRISAYAESHPTKAIACIYFDRRRRLAEIWSPEALTS
jgi:hypothetical protein